MRRAAYEQDGRFRIEDCEAAEPGPGEVRIRVQACGICGTDLHYMSGGLMMPGHTPGHEMMGRIDRVGPGVSDLAEGQTVAVEPLLACGDCSQCRSGLDSICREMRLFGVHLPGGLAESIVVPAFRAHPLAEGIDAAVGALSEPIAVAVHGLDRVGLQKGERVLVLGSGTVGLVTLVAARSLGAGEVIVTARHAHQAELAKRLGATRVLAENEADAGIARSARA